MTSRIAIVEPYPNHCAVVNGVLAVWPQHEPHCIARFFDNSPDFLAQAKQFASLAIISMGEQFEYYARYYRWMCEEFLKEEVYFCFESSSFSDDNRLRGDSYVANAKRVFNRAGNLSDFLQSLEMIIQTVPFDRIARFALLSSSISRTSSTSPQNDIAEVADFERRKSALDELQGAGPKGQRSNIIGGHRTCRASRGRLTGKHTICPGEKRNSGRPIHGLRLELIGEGADGTREYVLKQDGYDLPALPFTDTGVVR